jgi:hypothetical protein
MTIYFPLRINSGETVADTFTYPDSKTIIYSKPNETITYNYNDKGQIESIISNQTGSYVLFYDPNGQIFATIKVG